MLCNQRRGGVCCEHFHLWRHPHHLIDGASSDYIPECKCLDSANNVATAWFHVLLLNQPTSLQSMGKMLSPSVVLEAASLTHTRRGGPGPLYVPSAREISFHRSGGTSRFSTLLMEHLAHLLTASIKDLRTNSQGGGRGVRFRLHAGSPPPPGSSRRMQGFDSQEGEHRGTIALTRSPCHLLHESPNMGSAGLGIKRRLAAPLKKELDGGGGGGLNGGEGWGQG